MASNCSRDLSSTFPLDRKHFTSSSMGTILGWLKDGGMVEAEMKLSTQSSGGYTHYLKAMVTDTRFIPPMSRASQIQQTDSREASTPRQHSFFHPYTYPQNSKSLSSTHRSHSPPSSKNSIGKEDTHHLPPKSSTMLTSTIRRAADTSSMLLQTFSCGSAITSGETDCQMKFDNPLTDSMANTNKLSKPRPYQPGLTPAISPLHPHCLAHDRLRNWCPFAS